MMENQDKAVHLPGGNYLDNMQVDLAASFQQQDHWLSQTPKKVWQRSRISSFMDRCFYRVLSRLNLWEAAVSTGICSEWLRIFQEYWCGCLQGRPLHVMDFHSLYFNYRCKFQSIEKFDWKSAEQHVQNWQHPENLFLTLQLVLHTALQPIRSDDLLSLVKPGMRILEYGCSTAPMYATWRRFASHIPCQWTLADIPGFPFHYARHLYGGDAETHFITITPEHFQNPLEGEGPFDVIILQEVLEHLDSPRHMIQILTESLKPGGLIFVDYVKSEALHLDSEAGLRERMDVLDYLEEQYDWIRGRFENSTSSLPQVIGRKRG